MKREKGFTLIELMIVVAIIAIIAGFAMFNYSKYGFRSRRVDGKDMLTRVVAAQERYYTNFNKYASSLGAGGLNFTGPTACPTVGYSEKCYYLITTTTAADGQSYSLTAAPQGAQVKDACLSLYVTSTNQKTFQGTQSNGNCW